MTAEKGRNGKTLTDLTFFSNAAAVSFSFKTSMRKREETGMRDAGCPSNVRSLPLGRFFSTLRCEGVRASAAGCVGCGLPFQP